MKTSFAAGFFLAITLSSFQLNVCFAQSHGLMRHESTRLELKLATTNSGGVARVAAVISRKGFRTLRRSLLISNDTARCTLNGLHVGDWNLSVNAYDLRDRLKYHGETTVKVSPGMNLPVNLELTPVDGAVSISVTWGNREAKPHDMALEFDGYSGYVVFPPSRVLQPKLFTVELKARFDPTSSPMMPLVIPTNLNLWNSADGYCIRYENHQIGFSVARQANLGYGIQFPFDVPRDKWVDIACTYDGHYMSIYVNGKLGITSAYSTPVYYGDAGFSLGRATASYLANSPFYFKGAIDDLCIWDYPMTGKEIRATLHSKLTGKEPGLVGYWNFDRKSSDRQAIDRTGNDNNGRLIGGVRFVPIDSLW